MWCWAAFHGTRDKNWIARDHHHTHHNLKIAQVDIILRETIKKHQAAQRFALPALGRAAGRRPIGKMLRRRKRLGIAPESPASGARFVSPLFAINDTQAFEVHLKQHRNLLGISFHS